MISKQWGVTLKLPERETLVQLHHHWILANISRRSELHKCLQKAEEEEIFLNPYYKAITIPT